MKCSDEKSEPMNEDVEEENSRGGILYDILIMEKGGLQDRAYWKKH